MKDKKSEKKITVEKSERLETDETPLYRSYGVT